ncbi:MAG: hypothetical protein LBG62_03965 [Candidatus Methanoplasma sp.]|jgi:predicted transcriptional regulator|nr:hypothetical protein [Candidatus Methanoplasma sp.]
MRLLHENGDLSLREMEERLGLGRENIRTNAVKPLIELGLIKQMKKSSRSRAQRYSISADK